MPEKRPTVICDVDGTLLHYPKDGNPYDHDLYPEYTPDKMVVTTVNHFYATHRIVLLTGRSERHRNVTVESLEAAGLMYDRLFMQPNNLDLIDLEYKREFYHRVLAEHHDVQLVLEDRQRVVDMWREEGLKVFQVESGQY